VAKVSKSSDLARMADVRRCPTGSKPGEKQKKVRWKRRRLAIEKEVKDKGKPGRETSKSSSGDLGAMEESTSEWNTPGKRG
jgi:hypothetical protein